MTHDIRPLLKDWHFDPDGVTVRSIEAEDGRELIQLRIDLGLMQMEVDGRPDGKRIEGLDSWLDLHRQRQTAHEEANPDGAPYLLEPEDCAELMREGVQYYHRYVSFWALKRYELCARDTERNLRLFKFVRTHARLDNDRLQFDQWRPYVTMMHTRAVATPLIELRQYEAAITSIEAGIERINRFLADYGREDQSDRINELIFLKSWRHEVVGMLDGSERPADAIDPIEIVRRKLAEAVESENYEEAATLRDELRRLEEPPPPTG